MNTSVAIAFASPAVLLLVIAFLPIVRGEHAFFGVPVSRAYYGREGRALLRRYWFSLAALFFPWAILSAFAFLTHPLLFVVITLLGVTATMCIYAVGYRRALPQRIQAEEHRIASSLRARRLRDYTHVSVEVIVVLFAVLPLMIALLTYRELPSPVPVHWDISGGPDRWAAKSVSSVFLLPAIAIYLQAFLLLLKHDSIWLKIALPAQRAEEYLQYKERLLRLSAGLLDWTRLMLALVFSTLALLFMASLTRWQWLQPALSVVTWCSLALLLTGLVWQIARWIALSNTLDREFGFAIVQRAGEPQHWHGGILYFNRNDPAFVVEKLAGLGITFNCGHPRIFLYLAAVFGLIGLAVCAP